MNTLNRLGARLGNWNDRVHPYDMRSEQSRRHRTIDRIASWLCLR
jgi:hypothetical protein